MAQVLKKGIGYFVTFTDAEAKELGIEGSGKEFELTKARPGIFLLLEVNVQQHDGKAVETMQATKLEIWPEATAATDDLAQKIIGMLRKLPPRDRMEGWFEKKLGKSELAKFREMLAKGEVTKFKSSEVFRKALYIVPRKLPAKPEPARKVGTVEKPFHEFTLEEDGFVVVKNEERAKALSEELRDKIKGGEIKGTRAFTGEFFIIYTDILDSTEKKVLEELKKAKHCTLGELAERLKLIQTLIRIALEFLKEDGQIIEKRKDYFQYID